jgi:hypothetical protein
LCCHAADANSPNDFLVDENGKSPSMGIHPAA